MLAFRKISRSSILGMMVTAGILLGACSGDGEGRYTPVGDDPDAERPPLLTQPPEVAQLFPQSAYRGVLINRCSSCHSVACTLVGDRTIEDWHNVEASHVGYIPGLSIEDRGKIFDYLIEHFAENAPRAEVPARFLDGGCPVLSDSAIAELPEWEARLE